MTALLAYPGPNVHSGALCEQRPTVPEQIGGDDRVMAAEPRNDLAAGHERLRDAAQELAEKVAKNSPAAMKATKRALWGALEYGLTDACRAGAQELVGVWGHPDQTEGPLAFSEKREPQWLELERDDDKPAH